MTTTTTDLSTTGTIGGRSAAATPAVVPDRSAALPVGVDAASPAEVRRWMESGKAILVDVREPDEHARERIAGALSVPLSRFDPSALTAHAAAGRRMVLHCRTGRRSGDALRQALAHGVPAAALVNMEGGLEAWKKEGLPVQVDVRVSSVSIMRQVQMVVGFSVLAGSILAWFVSPLFLAIPAFFGAGLAFAGLTGTCALATVLGFMPWNRAAAGNCAGGSCQ